jgi:muconolactone D-isomerase
MLFHVHMVVSPPLGMAKDAFEDLRSAEKARAQALMRQGKWRHLWRIAGKYENYSIFDVIDVNELHDILTSLPFFPFMKMEVTPICRHPSSIRDDDA